MATAPTPNGQPQLPSQSAPNASAGTDGKPQSKNKSDFLTTKPIQTQSKQTFDGWMSSVCCPAPKGCAGCGGCCLTWYCPCCMYGKTHWRLDRVRKEKDSENSSWKCKNGFNPACGLFFVLTWVGAYFVPIAFERSRIRATYGIEGSQGRDWVCAICCPWCVLLKNDREVRAREGNQKFVSNKKYKEYVDVQPQAPLPMMYQPPESFFDRDQVLPDHVEKTPRKKTVVRERSGNRPAVDGARSLSNVPSITPHPRSVDLSPVPGDGTASLRSRRASAALDNSEPSYRHDFTDCDRSVLEYLERQGSAVGAASKQRVVGSFSRSVAPMMLGRRSSSYSL